MERHRISIEELSLKPHAILEEQGMLLTAGDFAADHYNTMTIGWGSFGVIWNRLFAQVVVRPVRYTYEFMNKYDTFTISGFPDRYREAMMLLGTKSGRDGNKIAEAKLTPIASSKVAAPGFAEANLIIECRKIYWDDLNPAHFLDPALDKNYTQKDYHRVYFGEIVAIFGDNSFRA